MHSGMKLLFASNTAVIFRVVTTIENVFLRSQQRIHLTVEALYARSLCALTNESCRRSKKSCFCQTSAQGRGEVGHNRKSLESHARCLNNGLFFLNVKSFTKLMSRRRRRKKVTFGTGFNLRVVMLFFCLSGLKRTFRRRRRRLRWPPSQVWLLCSLGCWKKPRFFPSIGSCGPQITPISGRHTRLDESIKKTKVVTSS